MADDAVNTFRFPVFLSARQTTNVVALSGETATLVVKNVHGAVVFKIDTNGNVSLRGQFVQADTDSILDDL